MIIDMKGDCMIHIRRYEYGDEFQISEIITKDLYTENIKDYEETKIKELAKNLNPDFIKKRAEAFHAYVVLDDEKIIGIGMIGPYWNSLTESSFFTIFIDPEYKGKGIGRKIIETLESDVYYKRANRIEIPASITGLNFYKHFGYGFKITDYVNGNIVDDEGEYRLEKYPKKSYYNTQNIYNVRPYIDNKYHKFDDLIYSFIKEEFRDYKTFKRYINSNFNDLYIIEYNGSNIGYFDRKDVNKIYLIDEYMDSDIKENLKKQLKLWKK